MEEDFSLALSLLRCQLDLLSGKSEGFQSHGDIYEVMGSTKSLLAKYDKIRLLKFGQYEHVEGEEEVKYKIRRFERANPARTL